MKNMDSLKEIERLRQQKMNIDKKIKALEEGTTTCGIARLDYGEYGYRQQMGFRVRIDDETPHKCNGKPVESRWHTLGFFETTGEAIDYINRIIADFESLKDALSEEKA